MTTKLDPHVANLDAVTDAKIDARIQEHRTSEVTLTVTGKDGKPLANADVTVAQTQHAFGFGIFALGVDLQQETAFNRRLLEVFNLGVQPLYLGGYEAEKDNKPWEQHHHDMARWFHRHGCQTKGHPLVWHSTIPDWLDGSADDIRRMFLERVKRDVSRFKGLIDTWDVVNEACYTQKGVWDFGDDNNYVKMVQEQGLIDFIKEAHNVAREANPNAILTLNDFDNSAKGLDFYKRCQDSGLDFDVVGMQTHMYADVMEDVEGWEEFTRFKDRAEIWETAERFSTLGKPMHFTELDISSGCLKDWKGGDDNPDWCSTPEGEQRQLEYAVMAYRVMFSHPNVESIVWWDFDDPGFLHAPIGLLHHDRSAKPAFFALKRLIKENWWTHPFDVKTDAKGQVTFRGFHGQYEVDTQQGTQAFKVSKDTPKVSVSL